MDDRIEKRIELKAPVARVWRALTDYREFGEWFRVKLDGPFVPGKVSRGQVTHPGYEHLQWEAVVAEDGAGEDLFFYVASVRRRSQSGLFEGDAHAGGIPAGETQAGTLLVVTESGFDKIPAGRRAEAFLQERWRLGAADEEYRKLCRAEGRNRATAAAAGLCAGVCRIGR